MSFGIFTKGQNESLDYAQQHLAEDLPLEFSEAFDAAWREGLLFGQSVSSSTARMQGVQEYLDSLREKTGTTFVNPAFAPIGGGSAALDELNGQFAALAPKFPELNLKPLTAEDLDRFGEDKARRARQAYRKAAAREQTWGGTAGLVLGSLSAGAADPINIVTLPLAAPKALGILGTALATAGLTAGTQVGIEAVAAPFKERVEPGYGASGEAGDNVVNAAIAGGVLGGGAKGLAAIWTRYKTGSWPRSVRDAGNVVASEGQIDATNLVPTVEGEVAHRTALQQSIDALVSGRPVDVSETITPDLLRAYGERLDPVLEARGKARAAEESAFALEREGARLPSSMERLSELQLAEILGSARALEREAADVSASLRGETDSLSVRRATLEGRASARDAIRSEVEGLRSDLEAVQTRLNEARAPNDPDTQARLTAIDADLAAEGLTATRRAELGAERTTITETLAGTAPSDARAIGRMEAEAKGLRIALARKEKAFARAEDTDGRARAALDKADADLPRRIAAGEQRTAGRREAVTTELRRTVARLAQDGYGIRLTREEAEQIAGRIIAAGDGEADTVLRSVTEQLVDRSLEQRRAQPAPPPSPGRPDPVAEQRARVGHWTDQTRKRIQGLAREVGYEMPRDEAATVAAAVARAQTDDEALAILDEVLLRPRTIAETLPGSLSANRLQLAQSRLTGAALAVREDVYRQLIAAGEPEDRAATGAAIWAARYDARARRLGLDPAEAWDLYQKEGVDIRAGEVPDALGPDALPQQWIDTLVKSGESEEVDPFAAYADDGVSGSSPVPANPTGARAWEPTLRVDPNAEEWTLYHGTAARVPFDRFDPATPGAARHSTVQDEWGAVWFTPEPAYTNEFSRRSPHANMDGMAVGDAGPRTFKVKVTAGKSAIVDLPELVRNSPEFRDLMTDTVRRRAIADGGNPAEDVRMVEDRLRQVIKDADDAVERENDLLKAGLFDNEQDYLEAVASNRQLPLGLSLTTTAVRWGQKHGYDTIVVRGMRELGGADQVAVLRPDRVFSAYSGEKLYQGKTGGLLRDLQEKGEKLIPAGEGNVVRVSMRKASAGDKEVLGFDLFPRPAEGEGLPDNVHKALGHVEMVRRDDGRWEVDWAYASKNARGQGIATQLYDAAEKELGTAMVPSGELLPDGYAFWKRRNPEAVKWHTKIGKAYYSPRRMLEEAAQRRMQQAAGGIEADGGWGDAFQRAYDALPPEAKRPEMLDRMFQSAEDRGGRTAPVSVNADVDLQPVVLADLPMVESWKAAEGAVPKGRAENLSGSVVEVSNSAASKWFSRANDMKRSLAPHLVDVFRRSVTYHDGADGWSYAIGHLNLDGQDIAVRFAINTNTGKGAGKLYQIEGVEVAPIYSQASRSEPAVTGEARGPSRPITVADAVGAFNRMQPGERPLFQPEGAAPRGAITLADNRALIELFQGRDASTFMHESSHLWLTELVRDAEVSPEVKADLDATLRWLGVDDAAKIGRAEQEKWAQGFEQYLRDGKAPSTALARAFEQFKEWLTAIYRAVADLGDPIPDDIRGVMDRMLAVPEQEVARSASPSRAAPARPEQIAALAPELAPAKLLAARSSEETEAAVLHDLDKLRATRDLQIPVGERLDETGARVADMRSVDELMDEADARLAAAAEIRACAMPMPEVTL